MTIYEVKQKTIDALGDIDVSKLSVMDVHCFVESLHKLNEIKEPDPTWGDTMKLLTEQMHTGFGSAKPATLNDLR